MRGGKRRAEELGGSGGWGAPTGCGSQAMRLTAVAHAKIARALSAVPRVNGIRGFRKTIGEESPWEIWLGVIERNDLVVANQIDGENGLFQRNRDRMDAEMNKCPSQGRKILWDNMQP